LDHELVELGGELFPGKGEGAVPGDVWR
jgi:hypothetical protein